MLIISTWLIKKFNARYKAKYIYNNSLFIVDANVFDKSIPNTYKKSYTTSLIVNLAINLLD